VSEGKEQELGRARQTPKLQGVSIQRKRVTPMTFKKEEEDIMVVKDGD
jgi:hypothetical protein